MIRRRMFIQYLQTDPAVFFAVVITVVVSITVHELAHGVVAVWRGDRTPIEEGHMTLNPAVHMGVFSIVALLLAGIAWGLMPINPQRMRGRYAEAMVAAAGPVSNLLLAVLSLTALGLWYRHDEDVLARGTPAGNLQFLLWVFGYMNVALAFFNMIPIPPLDGSRILENFSDGYRRLSEMLSDTGASFMIFIVAFSSAGKVILPASRNAAQHWLELVGGFPLKLVSG
jgi:Zn-dependent protease